MKCGRHNHHLPSSLVGHAYAARMENEDQSMVKWFSATGSSPKVILESLRMQKKESSVELISSIRTLYNEKAKMKREALEFRTCYTRFNNGITSTRREGLKQIIPP